MYLIFQAAIKLQAFTDLIHTDSYSTSYKNASGNTVDVTWANTNGYLSGDAETPEGITVVGGKTGTTTAAGYCLVLYSTNSKGEDIVSIVFKADGRLDLYSLMNQILSSFAN
jgi:D-alanyl-D-alanine carboxypeptidase (penicillin-binding protein 5/6)